MEGFSSVDVDDAFLAALDVATRRLQQLEDDVLDVFADVAGFSQRRGVDDGEGHRQHARQRLGHEGLARAGRPDEQDVGLGQLDVVARALLGDLDALVVIVDGDGELLFGLLLADDVLVEEALDLLRRGQAGAVVAALDAPVVGDDVVADLDALVADEDRRTRDQLTNVVLVFVAERAP
jgi:hypothetical protein